FVGKTLLHGDVLMWLMKTLLTSRCINQRGAGQLYLVTIIFINMHFRKKYTSSFGNACHVYRDAAARPVVALRAGFIA
ncbi:hypothetical protein, partial [Klebsiella pneumoniae]|uniref:hypothetical protein n=1 Tax=Klebsiella pneumoniae TaxID=573 RepID=UPI001B8B742A